MEDKNNGSPVNNESKPPVPFLAHESAIAQQERTIKRLWILCIIIFVAFVWSNLWWVCYEMQYEDVVTETYESTTSANNPVFVNGNGTLNYNDENKVH